MYTSDKNANIAISRLRHDLEIISEWFYENCTVLRQDKSHQLTLGFNKLSPDFSFSNIIIENVTEGKILSIVNFKSSWNNICQKANQKLGAVPRTSKLTTLNQWVIVVHSVIKVQFFCCPLICMFTSKSCNRGLDRIHR